jgi:NADPH:quinone reductase-like Zn-dependent oxidoreductase
MEADMRAVQFDEYGGPDVLHVAEAEEPHAGAGQVRVAVRAAGVNPIDWKLRSGAMAQIAPVEFPAIPGVEVAGVVDEVGDGVNDVAVGDELFGFAVGGGAAEEALLEHYAAKPAALSWAAAAAVPAAAETAVRTLDLLGVVADQTVLVNGAAGGVGTAAVQFARVRGARVIGTASEANHEFLRTLGAEPTTYGEGMVDRVRQLAPDGVDRALDTAGRGALVDLIEITGSPDNVVTTADFSAPEHGVRATSGADKRAWQALGQAAELYEAGEFSMPVEQAFPLDQAAEAQRRSQAGHVRGKLVLTVS